MIVKWMSFLRGQSNIKIQWTGPGIPEASVGFLPATDLERWANQDSC